MFLCYFFGLWVHALFSSLPFVISTSVIDCLGRFVPEMTYYVSSLTLNLTKLKLWWWWWWWRRWRLTFITHRLDGPKSAGWLPASPRSASNFVPPLLSSKRSWPWLELVSVAFQPFRDCHYSRVVTSSRRGLQCVSESRVVRQLLQLNSQSSPLGWSAGRVSMISNYQVIWISTDDCLAHDSYRSACITLCRTSHIKTCSVLGRFC